MRTPGTPEDLERKRLRAIELLKGGKRPSEVAALLGVSRPSVSIWKKAFEKGGVEGLKAKPHPGPAPKLTTQQCERLARFLRKGPTAHGYSTELWTLRRVAEVIEKHFGVSYEQSAVWRVLRRMGWSCQKPERRARERDESAIVRWRAQEWPRIKKRPRSRP